MQAVEKTKHDAAIKLAAQRGLPLRVVKPNGAVMELMQFDGDRPVYAITHNVNAVIATDNFVGCGSLLLETAAEIFV